MSDNTTVPSAEKFQRDYYLEQYDEGGYLGIDEREASKMLTDFTRLHLEAMAKEIAYNMFDTKYRDIVMNKAADYISKIK